MSHFNKDVSVILVDWHNLASAFYFAFYFDFDNYVYDYAARNAIDVGEFLGLCLAELKKRYVHITRLKFLKKIELKIFLSHDVAGSNIHLVGHSLGAHLVVRFH